VHPGADHLTAGGHLVLDRAGLLGLAFQGEGHVEVVIAVVALHVPDHQQLALHGVPCLLAVQHVQLDRPLDAEREPVGMDKPGIVGWIGHLDLLHPAHGQDGDVALHGLAAGLAPGDLDRAAERLGLGQDRVGELEQVLGLPAAVGDR
jgi:hypothetical protein